MTVYDKPVVIERFDAASDEWFPCLKAHASVNNSGGAWSDVDRTESAVETLRFAIRWSRKLELLRSEINDCRVVYKNRYYNVAGYDDYMESHREVRIVGERSEWN